MIFSVTERGVFRRCRRMAVLTSRNGQRLTPVFDGFNLAVGTLVHEAHQRWLEDPSHTMAHHCMTASVGLRDQIVTRYTTAVGVAPIDSELADTYESVAMALAMSEQYETYWGAPLPAGYTFLSAEQKVRVPIEETRRLCPVCTGRGVLWDHEAQGEAACATCNGTGEEVHYLAGKLDGLLQHNSGRLDVLEHKTWGQHPKPETLASSDQFLAYVYLVRRLKLNDLAPCVAYDGMWRRDKVPRGRKLDDLFVRRVLSFSRHELEEFEKFLPYELNHMAEQYRQPETAYPNRVWQGCWDCKVEPLCTAMRRGEDTVALISMNYTRYEDEDEDSEEG